MIRQFLLFFCFLFLLGLKTNAQKQFFQEKDQMLVGAYYYPEQWSEDQWERDIKSMSELGFDFTHFAEFAWSQLEPEEGKFNFEWLDKALMLVSKYDMKVIMCTQSCTPPAWLAIKHPEIFRTDSRLIQQQHGGRANMSYVNATYRFYLERITTLMAKRYGQHPAVMGWQIHNEPYGDFDYSADMQHRFTSWLKHKYTSINRLNQAWGNAFWSQMYNDFEQIKIPNTSILQWGINPHALLDYKRFNADMVAEFLDFQAILLKKHISPSQFVTTNYIAMIENADARRTQCLDFVSFTNYLVYGDMNIGKQGFRIGNPYGIDFGTSFYKNIGGTTGLMELQPGQVNWGNVNPQVMPGAVRMWLWHAYAVGNSFACTYRYRQPLYGSEQYHYGIMQTDGVSLSQGGKEYKQFIQEMSILRKGDILEKDKNMQFESKKTAILWTNENRWDVNQQKQTTLWNTENHMLKYMDIVRSTSAPIDIIGESTDLSAYPFLIIPAYQQVDNILVDKWRNYVNNGGNLIITCRTGHKDRDGHLWEGKWASPLVDLIGADISFFDLLPDGAMAKVKHNQIEYDWHRWGEILAPKPNTTILATYSDQFYQGMAAVVSRKLGKGSVTYIGVDTETGALEKQVVYSVYSNAGVKNMKLPDGVFVNYRNGKWIAVNYSSNDYDLSQLHNGIYLVGDAKLSPADVAVW